MMPLVLPLPAVKKKDEPIVGAKAFRLAQLISRDLPVPGAFVLTTVAFDLFFEKNNLGYLLERLSLQNDRSILENICRELKRKIKKGEFPKNLKEQINQEIFKNKLKRLAVRSSATSEDLAFASFAGQFESYLNIKEEKVFDFIKTCWSSLYEERVVAYTLYHQIPMHEIKMAVLVQEMINAEKGGVIFTKDVLRDDERLIIIEAARGLGTQVVDGIVEPDRFVVEKTDLKIIQRKLKSHKPVLNDEEVFQLASLGLLIENFYQKPQDLELAAQKEKIYLLQTRPITV
ncbi:PEP/pyruvate-binding domain-containing protein [Patescibacteria group bacterium]|nr:PEP/pyruvate-binding domain-containing protein [Patescibacteria group bacterium]